MKSLPFWFIALGSLFALAGMAWGIQMAISQDHTMAPAHAHNNLIGFVAMTIYGVYYKLVPKAAVTGLARVHFGLALLGALGMGPGIAMTLSGGPEIVVQIASILTILSMAVFAFTVFRNRSALEV